MWPEAAGLQTSHQPHLPCTLPFPSCCLFKPLSGKKFDYRAFAALPSSRPVYDIQVLGATWPICTLLPPHPCLSPAFLHSFLCASYSVSCMWGLPTHLGVSPVCSDHDLGSVGLAPDSHTCMGSSGRSGTCPDQPISPSVTRFRGGAEDFGPISQSW